MIKSIRKIKEIDREEVFSMMKAFYASDAVINKASDEVLYGDIDESLKDDLLTCYVAIVDDNIAGYTMLSRCYSTEYGGECIWIEDIYIKPIYRNQGLGNMIFDYIEKLYYGKVVRFKLEVEVRNSNAIKLYKSRGYSLSKYSVMTKEV